MLKKAYSDISARIGYSLATSPQSAVEVMRLVNDYFASTLVKSEGSMTLLAFNIKRDEFDCAKTRSRRAHERAVTRKIATGKPRYLSTEEIVERILAGLTLEDFEEISLPTRPYLPEVVNARRPHAPRNGNGNYSALRPVGDNAVYVYTQKIAKA